MRRIDLYFLRLIRMFLRWLSTCTQVVWWFYSFLNVRLLFRILFILLLFRLSYFFLNGILHGHLNLALKCLLFCQFIHATIVERCLQLLKTVYLSFSESCRGWTNYCKESCVDFLSWKTSQLSRLCLTLIFYETTKTVSCFYWIISLIYSTLWEGQP